MAMTYDSVECVFGLTDQAGKTSNYTYHFVGSPNRSDFIGNIETQALSLAAAFALATKSAVGKMTLKMQYTDPAAPQTPQGLNASKANVTVFLEVPGGGIKKAVMAIPNPSDALRVGLSGSAYQQVDVAATELTGFISNFQETGGNFQISDGETIRDSSPIDQGSIKG